MPLFLPLCGCRLSGSSLSTRTYANHLISYRFTGSIYYQAGQKNPQQLLLRRVFLEVWRARARRRRPERLKVMSKSVAARPSAWDRPLRAFVAVLAVLFTAAAFQISAVAQDQDDPPGRVARLGYMQGSVSFQPAGENEWVEAAPNRPMTTGDKLWADRDSRAEIQLGSSTINLAANTGISFLNLDDRTVQIQLSAGSMNVRVWDVERDNVFEIDTANQAFTIGRPGRYRVDASENGDSTVVTVREGEGESTGNGQSYTVHAGQRFTFTGTDSLNAEVDQIGRPDDFDDWADRRERRYQDSPSARYCDRRVVGFEDLDEYGDWSPTPDYGYAWFPRVSPGWAPYHTGHWAWIDPWGWTWVDDNPWGYAPFHYGRWAYVRDRWGWIPGPREVRPVYAPALVAFVGGGAAVGATVAWFPLGPREVYVPSYRVSPAYVNRVNVSNTTVNQTTVTNVYNTTVINNNNTTINNVRYVNRNVNGAVTAVPQRSFASAQPVAQSAIRVNPQQLRAMPVTARAAVPPARASVLGAHANTAGRVAAPPQAVVSRQVIAKTAPPPPPPSFAAREKLLAQHPGMPVPRQELAKLRPANAPESHVRVAPPARPAQPTPAPARAGQPANGRPGGNPPPANQPGANNRPGNNFPNNRPQPNQPAPNARPEPGGPPARNDRPSSAQPNRPEPNQPNARPEPGGPPARNDRPPSAQPNRPERNQPAPNARPEPTSPPARNDRPPSAQPNRPEATAPAPDNRPESARPSPRPPREDRPPSARPDNRPDPNQPRPNVPMPAQSQPNVGRPDVNRPDNRPEPPARNERPSEQPRTEPAPRQAPPDRPQSRPEARPAPQERPQPQREARPAPQDRPQSRPDARPAPQDRPQAQREAGPAKQDQKNQDNRHH